MTAEVIENPISIDEGRLNALMGQFVTDLGAMMQAPLMLVGDELGLYRALSEEMLTSKELAERTETTERYVREWARSQAAAGYVSYDSTTDRYFLGPEQALLFDESSPVHIVGGFEVANAAAHARSRLVDAFRTGDGIGWGEHEHTLFSGTASFFGAGYRANLVSSWIPALDGVEAKLEAGANVADIGCGHGISTLLMAERYARSSFVGFDFHQESIDEAQQTAREKGVDSQTRFLKATAKDFPGEGYDLVTLFDCLHDLGDPLGALRHIRESLAEDGTVMIVEPNAGGSVEENLNPVGRVFYSASTIFCTPNSLSQEVGHALGAQAGEAAVRELAEQAGFTRFRRATETPFNIILEARP